MAVPEILFEDNHLLVAVKPAGVLSQADITGEPDMLSLLKKYLIESKNKPGEAYLGLLHRLDRPVSGIMVFAKTSKCASRLSAQIRERRVDKRYRAIVRGKPSDEAQIRSFILKDEDKNQVTVLHGENAGSSERAKEAILEYRKLGEAERECAGAVKTLSLLEVHLQTGRSHQIRAQLADAGFPILGDRKYGPDDGYFRGDICLESYKMSFFHPVSGEKMCFSLPLSAKDPWNLFHREGARSLI